MSPDDFEYILPSELIAQEPAKGRDRSRLMTLDRTTGSISETSFGDISQLFHPGDLLVINDTRVIPARLQGHKESGGKIEIFLVRRYAEENEVWDCLVRCSKPPREGVRINFPGGISGLIESKGDGECWRVSFSPSDKFAGWLDIHGKVPLPPYIRREPKADDRERYQTVFAKNSGAVAAPTAGLHFTKELLDKVRERGVKIATVTLHVGLGTFMPIRSDDLKNHRMHREQYRIPAETAELVIETRKQGGRVVALGTTVVRALEQAASAFGDVKAVDGEADIFIYPGYKFKVVDALITNFHLPRSSLLMLTAAFAGKDFILKGYAEAVERRFRFFSYGDAMFIS